MIALLEAEIKGWLWKSLLVLVSEICQKPKVFILEKREFMVREF